jgi:cyclic pyranopterin phosphate synthase
MSLFRNLGGHLGKGLDELTLTTNATLLQRHAEELAAAGVRRVNISLDTLDPQRFATLTRTGDFGEVMTGVDAAVAAGLRVKINTVALKGVNDDEFDHLIEWCGERGFDLTFIESMPMGDIGELRDDHFLSLDDVRERIEGRWTLTDSTHSTGGPSRYQQVEETGQRIGFITPYSHNFCESCNRVRLTCTGTLYLCLGQDDATDLRQPLRDGASDEQLKAVILEAIARKPKGHDFDHTRLADGAQVVRFMNTTGG